VLEVLQPGLLVVKYSRLDPFEKFGNVAVLEGDRIKVVDEQGASLPDCPAVVSALVGFDAEGLGIDATDVLVRLAIAMRAHGHGGLLLVVPHATRAWEASAVRPIPYAVSPPYTELAEVARRAAEESGEASVPEGVRRETAWQEAIRREAEAVAGLTAVDGATVITDRYELLAFGAKIRRARGSEQVETVTATEPVVGNVATVVQIAEIGGTRHLSAAQFVHDQRDALALVASQDGRFTVFAWSPFEGRVHAHRVEALLL
jgi:hypothetical protein